MIVVQIAGRLGKDAESRFTPSGQKVTTLTVATNVRKAGKEETVWWRVTIWGDRFDKMLPYLKKGSAIIVVGEMGKPDIWTDREGKPQVSLEITAEIVRFSPFSSSERSNQEQGSHQPQGQNPQNQSGYAQEGRSDSGYKAFAESGYQAVQPGQAAATGYAAQQADDEESLPF